MVGCEDALHSCGGERPQGLKPRHLEISIGAAEAAPFRNAAISKRGLARASTARSTVITLTHWPWRFSSKTMRPPKICAATSGGTSRW